MLDLLKDMKKVAQDAKTVTMKHPSGHTIVLITKKLPAIQKEALKRLPLAEGGEVKGVNKSEYEKPAKEIKNKYEKSNAGESKAGEHTRKYSEANSFQKNLSREEAVDAHHQVLGEMQAMPKPKLQGLAEGGMAHYAKGTESVSNADAINNLPQLQEPQLGSQQATQSPEPQPAQSNDPSQMQMNSAPGDTEQQARSTYAQALNQGNELQNQNANNEATFAKSKKAWDDFNADPNSKIDADEYRKNMSLPSKISTGIGLFLGGFSVPFGGQNFASDFLNKQIDRSIDAQKQNYEHQKNVYGAALDLFDNNQVAENFAKTVALDQVNNMIAKSSLTVPNPVAAQQRATALINGNKAQQAQLQKQSAQILTNDQASKKTQSFSDKVNALSNLPMSEQMKFAQASPGISSKIPIIGEDQISTASNQAPPIPENANPQKMQEDYEKVPETRPIPQFSVDEGKLKTSQYLGSKGLPNQITPGEVGPATQELGHVKQLNDKINLIHQNFETLWKNRSDSNAAAKYLSNLGVNAYGIHLTPPDLTTMKEGTREYYRAASTIENELSGLAGSGGLTEAQANTIRTKLIKEGDTPEEYKRVLKSIDDNMISNLQTPTLDKYNLVKRPKIKD